MDQRDKVAVQLHRRATKVMTFKDLGGKFLKVKERALLRLEKGFHLGGRPLSRKDIYER